MTLRSNGTTFALQRTVVLSSSFSPFFFLRFAPSIGRFSSRLLQLCGICDNRKFSFAFLFTVDVNDALASKVIVGKCPDMITQMDPTTTEMIIPNNSCNERASRYFDLNSFMLLEKVVIGNDCFSEVYRFVINGMPNLKSVVIGKNSFTQNKDDCGDNPHRSFAITNCPSLKIITIGQYSFSDYSGEFVIQNCNMLKHLTIGSIDHDSSNFHDANFILEGRNRAWVSYIDLISLQSIEIGKKAFNNCVTLTLKSSCC